VLVACAEVFSLLLARYSPKGGAWETYLFRLELRSWTGE
jgi:hypothetical protein